MRFIVFPKTLKHFIVSFVAGVSGELCYGETEQWFFFTSRQEREARGGKPNRTTASGYWKATGSPCYVFSSDNRVIGVKKTMVFYKGRAPSGRKTKWKMNEYTAIIIEEDIPSRKLIPKVLFDTHFLIIIIILFNYRFYASSIDLLPLLSP